MPHRTVPPPGGHQQDTNASSFPPSAYAAPKHAAPVDFPVQAGSHPPCRERRKKPLHGVRKTGYSVSENPRRRGSKLLASATDPLARDFLRSNPENDPKEKLMRIHAKW